MFNMTQQNNTPEKDRTLTVDQNAIGWLAYLFVTLTFAFG
jgi:hypothetical protein